MEQHASWLTHLVNRYLGQFVLALLSALHITPNHREMPIPEHVVMSMVVLVLGTLLALVLRSRLSADRPGGMQQVAEMLLTNPIGFGARDVLDENVGHEGRKYIEMVGAVGVFVLLSNLLGVFPFLSAPTGQVSVPLGCAVVTFLYFNWQGIRQHG